MWVINVYPHSSSKGDCYTKEHGRLDILILLRFLAVREVVIASVLDEDPPCVGVGGLCKIPPV